MSGPNVRRGTFVGMHAMNGSRKGLTLKKRFTTENEACAEADKLNADRDPAEYVEAYPCLFGDEVGTWGQASVHWHLGRDRAKRLPR